MPEQDPIIPCRWIEERVPFRDSKPRTFLNIGGDSYGDSQYIIHGYTSPDVSYEDVRKTISSAEGLWGGQSRGVRIIRHRGLGEERDDEELTKVMIIEEALERYPYVKENNPTAKWFEDAMKLELFGIKEIKANVAQMLATRVGRNNIEFGAGVYMHTPSTCVDISEEALMRNPADKRLLCDLNSIGKETTLPFEDNTFDSATMPVMMSYISDWKPFLGEVQRILKPNASSYIVLFQGGGGVIHSEDGVSIYHQQGPPPKLIPYLAELEKLGYNYDVKFVADNDGDISPFRIIEFSENNLEDEKWKNFWENVPELVKQEKTIPQRFEDNVKEFYEIIKNKYGHELCFLLNYDKVPKYPFEARKVTLLNYDHLNPDADDNEIDFNVTKEFKEYLLNKKGQVFFFPSTWNYIENIDKDVNSVTARIDEPDQFVFSLRDNYTYGKSLAGKFEEIRREYFTKIIDKIGIWNLYTGLKVEEVGYSGNSDAENEFNEIHDNSELREQVESDKREPVDVILELISK